MMKQNEGLLTPKHCVLLTEEEMTYTQGGAHDHPANPDDYEPFLSLGYMIGLGVSFCNYVWALGKTRDWIKKNKGRRSATQMISKAADDTFAYLNSSISNLIIGTYTVCNFVAWSTILIPVTALAWVTA